MIQKIRVLIAEDDALTCDRIHALLLDGGYEVVGEASDGRQAVEMTAALRPDVILMDIKMPEMDGLEAAARIRTDCPTPVVLLTNYVSSDLVTQASQVGAGAYIVKPSDSGEIGRAISIALARFADLTTLQKAMNREKALQREIYHRTKNHLQQVSSLLSLQASSLADTQAADLLLSSQRRVHALAALNEMLYRSKDLTQIDFSDYARQISRTLFNNYGVPGVQLHVDAEPIFLEADQVKCCGLVLTELVTNALKYAFPGGSQGGEVRVQIHQAGGNCTLLVSDNGVGFPPGFDWRNTESLGLQLVTLLAEQLQGEIELLPEAGTAFRVSFPTTSRV